MKKILIVLTAILVLIFVSSCDSKLTTIPNYMESDYVFAVSNNDADGSYAYLRLDVERKEFILIQYDSNPAIVFRGNYSYITDAYEFSRSSGRITFSNVESNNTSIMNALMADAGRENRYKFYWYYTDDGYKRIEMESLTPSLCDDLINGREIPSTEFDTYLNMATEKEENV